MNGKQEKTPGKQQQQKKQGDKTPQQQTKIKDQPKTPQTQGKDKQAKTPQTQGKDKQQGKTPQTQGKDKQQQQQSKTPQQQVKKEPVKTPKQNQTPAKAPQKRKLPSGVTVEDLKEGHGPEAKSNKMVSDDNLYSKLSTAQSILFDHQVPTYQNFAMCINSDMKISLREPDIELQITIQVWFIDLMVDKFGTIKLVT